MQYTPMSVYECNPLTSSFGAYELAAKPGRPIRNYYQAYYQYHKVTPCPVHAAFRES